MQDLFKVYLDGKSVQLIKDSRKLSSGLAAAFRTIAYNAVDQAGELGRFAAQSKIPIDTGELRNEFVVRDFPKNNSDSPKSNIYVLKGTHYGRDQKPLDSHKLAEYLQTGIGENGKSLFRTRNSAAIGSSPIQISFGSESKRSSTADWIGKADRAFRQKLGVYLRTQDFTR